MTAAGGDRGERENSVTNGGAEGEHDQVEREIRTLNGRVGRVNEERKHTENARCFSFSLCGLFRCSADPFPTSSAPFILFPRRTRRRDIDLPTERLVRLGTRRAGKCFSLRFFPPFFFFISFLFYTALRYFFFSSQRCWIFFSISFSTHFRSLLRFWTRTSIIRYRLIIERKTGGLWRNESTHGGVDDDEGATPPTTSGAQLEQASHG